MKSLYIVLILLTFAACTKSTVNSTAVDNYMNALVAGNYTERGLPTFNQGEIPALLAYRNDETVVTKFPHNPISSFYLSEVTLGVMALWTIESIRLSEAQDDSLYLRFPSLNPRLTTESSLLQEAQMESAQAYFNWWENNKDQPFDSFAEVDPLSDINYRWY